MPIRFPGDEPVDRGEPAGHDPSSTGREAESPTAPTIPSFDSLRAPRRRSAVDVLVPGNPPPPPPPAAETRPAEYADLLRLGVLVVRGGVTLPARLACWSLRQPVRLLHRLFGETRPPRSAAGTSGS